jgi:CheY-like chemotaxis protein
MMLCYLGYPLSQKASLDLAETVGSLVKVIRSTVHGHISVDYDGGASPARVQGDLVQIAQILNNLVENSIAAIGDNQGRIAIKVFQQSFHGRRLPISAQGEKIRAGNYGCIEVADNGCGMKPDILDKVIDPFFTTNFTGRGLGLSAAWGIARAHDGYLFIESEPGRGTTVRMYLPLISPSQIRPPQPLPPLPQQAKESMASANGLVLYVDDDQVVRMIGRRMLEHEGYQVLEAGGGTEAVAMVQEHGDELLGVVLDYAMPDMDGNLALIEMRKIRPDMPVLLVSGFLQEQAVAHFLTEKPNGFLQKPFHREEFIESVARILAPGQDAVAQSGRGKLS